MKKIAATIGIFDGVHRGHRKIFRRLVKEAKKKNAKTLALTFYPHPRKILNHASNVPLLTSLEHRLKLIKDGGVDYVRVIKFTKSLSSLKPDRFIKDVLINRFNVKVLVVGKNFLFGHSKRGDFKLLKKMSGKYGFQLFGVKTAKIKNIPISSTKIRDAIEKGDLKLASLMLGRPVAVFGTVVKGRRVGRKLGFPTANIDPHHEAIPPSGVYAVDLKINKRFYSGILNIGFRPTFGRYIEPTIELHIFDFKKNIYRKDIEIIFKRKIRNEKKFLSAEALRKQIQKDILRSR